MKFWILKLFLFLSLTTTGQNIRGFYLQDVGTWLGNITEENKILKYAQGNGFNYILFYSLGDIDWNNSAEKNKLGAFIKKSREYGIIQIGGVVEYAGYVSQNIIPYNNTRSSKSERFDVINLEFEFWVSSSISSSYCNKFLRPNGYSCDRTGAWSFAWKQLKLIDDICIANSLTSEIYLGWPTSPEMQQITSRADRILLSAYRPTDSDIYSVSIQRMKYIASIGGTTKTKIITLLSAESSFMGPWLTTHSQFKPYQTFSASFNSETQSFKNNISLQGYQWFTYRYLPKTIITPPTSTATISTTDPTTFCKGSSATLTANIGTNYLWSNGKTSRSIIVTTSGNYSVKVINSNGVTLTSSLKQIIVNPVPIITGDNIILNNVSVILNSTYGDGYRWSNGEITQSIVINQPGTFTVRTYTGPGEFCTSSPFTVTKHVISDINDMYNSNIKVYPTPANNFINVDNNGDDDAIFTLYNIEGKILLQSKIDYKLTVSTDIYPSGLYFYKICPNTKEFGVKKLLINH